MHHLPSCWIFTSVMCGFVDLIPKSNSLDPTVFIFILHAKCVLCVIFSLRVNKMWTMYCWYLFFTQSLCSNSVSP